MLHRFFYSIICFIALVSSSYAQNLHVDTSVIVMHCPIDSVTLHLNLDSALSTHDYTFEQLPTFQPKDSTGGTVMIPNSSTQDQTLFTQTPTSYYPIGFPFYFYCNRFTTVIPYVSGRIHFTPVSSDFANWAIPYNAPNTKKNGVFASHKGWSFLQSNNDTATIEVMGTAPNRKCVITYRNFALYNCTPVQKGGFQFVLHEGSNIIDIHLFNIPSCQAFNGYNSFGYGVMGIQNGDGTAAVAIPGRNLTYWTAYQESWRFTPVGRLYWTNAQGDTLGMDSTLHYLPTKSEYIYANALVCEDTVLRDSTFIIVECFELEMDSIAPVCIGDSSGKAIALCTDPGFTGPYTWFWTDSLGDTVAIHNHANISDTLLNVPAGHYFCRVFDSNALAGSAWVEVLDKDTQALQLLAIDLNCFQDSSGKIVALDTGVFSGTNWNTQYNFTLLDSLGDSLLAHTSLSVADTFYQLPAGTYTVVLDACIKKVGSIQINQPPLLQATLSGTLPTSCAENCDGQADINTTGGAEPYQFLWPSADNSALATQLCQGQDSMTVIDANGCEAMVYYAIAAPDSLRVLPLNDSLLCHGNVFNASGQALGGSGNYHFSWQDSLSTWSAQANTMSKSMTDTMRIRYWATDAQSCKSDTQAFWLFVRPKLSVEILSLDSFCPNELFTAKAVANGGDGAFTFDWSTGQVRDSVSTSFTTASNLSVTVSDGCGTTPATDNALVKVDETPAPIIAIEDDLPCSRRWFTLYINNHQWGNRYQWTVNGNADSTLLTDKSYRTFFAGPGCQRVSVVQTSATGCTLKTDTACIIQLTETPVAGFSLSDSVIVHTQKSIRITDESYRAESWLYWANEEIIAQQPDYTWVVADTGTYQIAQSVFNSIGCSDTAMHWLQKIIEPNVFLPNAFTPDGDGLNDVFQLRSTEAFTKGFQITIYDRWGKVVFTSNNPQFEWDGTFDGESLGSGIFAYEVVYFDYRGRQVIQSGVVNIIK